MQGIVPGDHASGASDEMQADAWSVLVELVADGVLETQYGAIVRANPQAVHLLGAGSDADVLVGRTIEELLEPRGDGPLECNPNQAVPCRVLGLGWERHVDLRTRVLDCSRALHLVTAVAPTDAASLEKSRGRPLARGKEQTSPAAVENSVAERLELVEVVCHELRTPITVIQGYAKLLLSGEVGPLNDEQRRFLQESAKSCQRLDDFVELLVRETGQDCTALAETVAVEASLAPLLEGVIDYLRPILEERRVRIEFELDPNALWARFDAARIEQVVANLVGNALEHTDSAVLRIHTRAVHSDPSDPIDEGSWVEVGVSDGGPGLPESDRQRIFEPHVRGARAISSRGIGLGLSICRRIVEAHGGRIAVRPAAPGNCFAFTLPAVDPKPRLLGADREG